MSDGWRIGIAALAPEAQTEWVRQHTEALRAECERVRAAHDAAVLVLTQARDEISKVEFDKVAVSDAIWAALAALGEGDDE